MNSTYIVCIRWLALTGLSMALATPIVLASTMEAELAGLWEARRILGPAEAGPLLIRKAGNGLVAEIAGNRAEVSHEGDIVAFDLASGARFDGEMEGGGNIRGHWLQPRSKLDGNVFGTPVLLRPQADGWYGEISPQPDTATFYLLLTPGENELGAELINPDRNLGVFAGLTRLALDGNAISLMGRFRGRGQERVMFRGAYYPDEGVIGLRYPGRGGAYDFHRVEAGAANGFLARTSSPEYKLSSPPLLDDDWETADPKDVGIDATPIEQMIRDHVLKPPSSTHDLSIHSVLIARNGKLAVEEYFHGYHRDLPHDSRSASKSVTSILAAAAMHDGIDLRWDTPAYPLFDTAELLQQEPERGDITLRHLVNMNTGLDCDDRNPESAANEDYLWDHADELDFYEHTINVEVLRPPGQLAAYCSASANLAGGVIAAAAGKSLLSVIDRLVARPLEIKRYAVPHSPDGHPFMGGGIRWLARDFLKFPQLLLNDGVWNDRRILSGADVQLMLTPAVKMDGGRDYAYLWWIEDYPYRGRTIRAHFMGGNGGQIAMLVPELELSVVFNAGNYSDRVMFQIQEELIPNYILPAIRE